MYIKGSSSWLSDPEKVHEQSGDYRLWSSSYVDASLFPEEREFVSIPQMTEARGRGRVNDLLSVAQFGCTPSPV